MNILQYKNNYDEMVDWLTDSLRPTKLYSPYTDIRIIRYDIEIKENWVEECSTKLESLKSIKV